MIVVVLWLIAFEQIARLSAEDALKTGPHLKLSLTRPVTKVVGDDALLTCVVTNQGDFSVMWKKTTQPRRDPYILSANSARVTSDQRVEVLHETSGTVYVLKISNVTIFDAGIYFCEVNTNPPVRSFHDLKVLKKLPKIKLPSPSSVSQSTSSISTNFPITNTTHNFTSCCMAKNVSTSCQNFCNLKTVLDGNTGVDPENCEEEFPNIVSCMADGRNHMPCCLEAGIPEFCSDLCRGEYTLQTDNIKTMFSCSAYTDATLACIAAGIETIPKQPEGIAANALNDTAISLSWIPPSNDHHLRDHYRVNVTFLGFLTHEFENSFPSKKARKYQAPFSTFLTVGKYKTDFVIGGLEKFSVYGVSMWAENKNGGKSLVTSGVKVVTHVEGESNSLSFERAPAVPDVRKCCVESNVSHDKCVNEFCDPHNVAFISLEDLMICAPWDTEIFRCLADGQDHSPCCAAKGLPPLCQELCSGNVTDINYEYFHCLSYMSELSSCMLEGYGVLPSSPQNFRFSNLQTDFAILHWDQPKTLGETVLDYVVVSQKISPTAGKQRAVTNVLSPFVLDQLESSSTYEVYVEPVNEHGIGQPSSRIVFRTPSKKVEAEITEEHPYNQTECCQKSGMKTECLPLCSYNANISDIERLAPKCPEDFTKLVRCATGGRDHLSCCARRGVPKKCQPLCQAVHQASSGAEFVECLPYIGQMFTCYEEGTATLPPPVRDLKAISVQDGKVFLAWKSDDNEKFFDTEHYEVFYKQVTNLETAAEVFASDKQINTEVPLVKIDGLDTGKIYRFFVVSRNAKGTSLPSSIVTLNVSSDAWDGKQVQGATSPPHMLELDSRGSTWLEFTWNTPAISHPEDAIKYRVYFLPVVTNLTRFNVAVTEVTTARLTGLMPDTQYAIYTSAVIVRDGFVLESTNSEELMVWTNPIIPAHVEIRVVRDNQLEGKVTGKHTFGRAPARSKNLNTVREGGSMTVLCIGSGMPIPTLTLSINGVAFHSQVTRYMATVVHNITKDVRLISCYANNDYGTPMTASRMVTVSRAPTLTAPMTTSVMLGDTLTLSCKVDAFPAPTLGIYRDKNLQRGVTESDRISITAAADRDDHTKYFLSIKIKNVNQHDGSLYYCHANNTMGEKTAMMGVTVKEMPPPVINVTDCCVKQNVTEDCLDICAFSIDFDTMLRKPQCIPQFQQLMSCASDGSDHRHCCSTGGVPGICLNWCRGEVVEETEVCALEHSRTIIGCFHEGQENLPGPPKNLKIVPLDRSSAVVTWDKPSKNPGAVEIYRVFWRPVGAKGSNKSDIVENKIVLHELESETSYEIVVKAGNAKGTSQLTEPVYFKTTEALSATQAPQKSGAGNAIGVVIAVLIIIVAIISVLYVLHKKNLIVFIVKKPDTPSIAFENPFYAIKNQPGPIQSTQVDSENYNLSGPWSSELSGTSSESSSESNTPRSQEETEVRQSSLMDKLRDGVSYGQGFQKF